MSEKFPIARRLIVLLVALQLSFGGALVYPDAPQKAKSDSEDLIDTALDPNIRQLFKVFRLTNDLEDEDTQDDLFLWIGSRGLMVFGGTLLVASAGQGFKALVHANNTFWNHRERRKARTAFERHYEKDLIQIGRAFKLFVERKLKNTNPSERQVFLSSLGKILSSINHWDFKHVPSHVSAYRRLLRNVRESNKAFNSDNGIALDRIGNYIVRNIERIAEKENERVDADKEEQRTRITYDEETKQLMVEEERKKPRPIDQTNYASANQRLKSDIQVSCDNSFRNLVSDARAAGKEFRKGFNIPISSGVALAGTYAAINHKLNSIKKETGKSKQQIESEEIIENSKRLQKQSLVEYQLEHLDDPKKQAKFDNLYKIVLKTLVARRGDIHDYFEATLPREVKRQLKDDLRGEFGDRQDLLLAYIESQLALSNKKKKDTDKDKKEDKNPGLSRIKVAMRHALGTTIRKFEGSGASIEDILSYIATNDSAVSDTTAKSFLMEVYGETLQQLFPQLGFKGTPASQHLRLLSPLLSDSLARMRELQAEILKAQAEQARENAERTSQTEKEQGSLNTAIQLPEPHIDSTEGSEETFQGVDTVTATGPIPEALTALTP